MYADCLFSQKIEIMTHWAHELPLLQVYVLIPYVPKKQIVLTIV